MFASALIALPFLCPFVGGPSVNVWQLLMAWACAALLGMVCVAGRPRRTLLLWMLASGGLLAVARGGHPTVSLTATVAVGAMLLACFVGSGLAQGSRLERSSVAWGLFAAGTVSAVLGLLQYYDLSESLSPWTTSPGPGQAYGNLRQRNQFATLISMALICALWLYGSHGSHGARGSHGVRGVRGRAWHRAWLMAAVALLTLGAAAATSRTGLLQWVMVSSFAAFLAWRERRRLPEVSAGLQRLPSPWLLLGLLPAYGAAAWLLPWLADGGVETMVQRLREGAPAGHSRLVLWRNVLELIAQRPWTGWGWGELSYAHYVISYRGPRFVEILDNAHNLPLHLAVELGVPAALLICAGFAWLVLSARPWRETDPARIMVWGVLSMIVLHSLLEYPLWYGPFQLVFGLALGFLWPAAPRGEGAPSIAPRRRHVAWRPRAAAAGLMAVVAYAAWDYTRISQIYLARSERLPPWRDDTLAKLQASRLFEAQVAFAELTLTPVSRSNAAELHALAERLLHFSPEPRVIVKLIESARLLGREDEADRHAELFRRAFPRDHALWVDASPAERAATGPGPARQSAERAEHAD